MKISLSAVANALEKLATFLLLFMTFASFAILTLLIMVMYVMGGFTS